MEDYLLNWKEKKEVISQLKSLNFDSLRINTHFYNKWGHPRHGVTIEKARDVFLKFDKIEQIFTRQGFGGKRYSVVYRLNKRKGYYLIFLLDNKPKELFDAFFFSGDVQKRLVRKNLGC